jgi:hypothetical protein
VLLLEPARMDRLTALLRRIPWVHTLVPGPQVVQWGVVTTYLVQLRALPNGQLAAALLNASPADE